jgi:hypothetical protein
MHYSTKRRVVLGMTTGGLLMTGLGMASAQADTTASGGTAHSPGIGSGNAVEVPINAPINVCGNQLDVIGILNSVTGNSCENKGGGGSTSATGSAKGSPGIGSGNLIEVPINAPVNVCGNQLDVIGIGDTVHGNSCENKGSGGSTTATGSAKGSPGIGSGNLIQVPINTPVNVCGNQVDVIGILNSVTGNSCENGGSGGKPPHPHPTPTPPGTPTPTPTTPVTPPPTSTPTTPPTGCSCPPPPPPTTPCPPSGTTTPTSTASTPGTPGTPGTSGTPSSTPSSTATTTKPPTGTPSATSTSTGWHGGGGSGGHNGTGSGTGSNGSSSGGKSGGVLAHTGSGAMTVAPLGAGLIGGGVFLRRRFPSRSH